MANRVCAGATGLLLAVATPTITAAQAPAAATPEEEVDGAPRASIAALQVEGELSEHLRAELRESLDAGLRRGGISVVPGPEQAAFSLRATLRVQGPDFHLSLSLLDVADGSSKATVERTCDLCGAEELRELTADLAATIGRKAGAVAKLETKLVVDSEPPGADVYLDGEVLGQTPLEVGVVPGRHEVVVGKSGYASRRHELSFDEGVRESLSVTLELEGPDRRARMFRIMGGSALGLGIGAAGAGTALLVLDGKPITTDCGAGNQDADGDCKWVHETLPGGIVLAAAGVGLIATGVTLLLLLRKRAEPRARAVIGPGGIGLRGRF